MVLQFDLNFAPSQVKYDLVSCFFAVNRLTAY